MKRATISRSVLDAMHGWPVAFIILVAAFGQACVGDSEKEHTMTPPDVRHISITIHRASPDVYGFASKPENLPRWARGLAGNIERSGSEWIAHSPMGRVRVRFAEPNGFGVLDHDVTLESGVTVHNPLRVVPRDAARSEVVFTLFRRPGVSEAEFERDAAAVEGDLRALKELLE